MRWPAAITAFLLLVPTAARPEDAPPVAAAAAEEPPNGAVLYAQHCAKCHGADGAGSKLGRQRGGNKKMPNFSTAAWQAKTKDADIRKIIEYGGPVTMGKDATLFKVEYESQTVAIIAYVRTLGPAAPPSETTTPSAK